MAEPPFPCPPPEVSREGAALTLRWRRRRLSAAAGYRSVFTFATFSESPPWPPGAAPDPTEGVAAFLARLGPDAAPMPGNCRLASAADASLSLAATSIEDTAPDDGCLEVPLPDGWARPAEGADGWRFRAGFVQGGGPCPFAYEAERNIPLGVGDVRVYEVAALRPCAKPLCALRGSPLADYAGDVLVARRFLAGPPAVAVTEAEVRRAGAVVLVAGKLEVPDPAAWPPAERLSAERRGSPPAGCSAVEFGEGARAAAGSPWRIPFWATCAAEAPGRALNVTLRAEPSWALAFGNATASLPAVAASSGPPFATASCCDNGDGPLLGRAWLPGGADAFWAVAGASASCAVDGGGDPCATASPLPAAAFLAENGIRVSVPAPLDAPSVAFCATLSVASVFPTRGCLWPTERAAARFSTGGAAKLAEGGTLWRPLPGPAWDDGAPAADCASVGYPYARGAPPNATLTVASPWHAVAAARSAPAPPSPAVPAFSGTAPAAGSLAVLLAATLFAASAPLQPRRAPRPRPKGAAALLVLLSAPLLAAECPPGYADACNACSGALSPSTCSCRCGWTQFESVFMALVLFPLALLVALFL